MTRLLFLLFPAICHAQDVYISTLGEPLPEQQQVQQAIDAWNTALGISLPFVGYTNQPCVDGAITYRMPLLTEWQSAMGSSWLTPAAAVFACQPELNYSGVVVLNSPLWGNPPDRVYTHELGHAIGARHVSDPAAIMYSGVVTAQEITPVDVRAVVDCTPWLGTDGVLRVPSLRYGGGQYGAQFSQVGGGRWYVTRRTTATAGCIWNYVLPDGDLALWQVYAQGKLYSVRLGPLGVYWIFSEVIKTGEVKQ